jgi:F-type H+-transporting ATPase subunit gamma
MPSLKQIRKRIVSVKNTQQITKAMKMVAAARLRRAQDTLLKGRHYAINLILTIRRLSLALQESEEQVHQLLRHHGTKRTLLVVITSDRGFCGGFNTNIIRKTEQFMREHALQLDCLDLAFIGRKGYDYFRRRISNIAHYFRDLYNDLSAETIREQVTQVLIDDFIAEKYDQIFLLYNEFKSAVSQRLVIEKLLPIEAEDEMHFAEEGQISESATEICKVPEYIYEPQPRELLMHLLPLHLSTQIFHAIQESYAAEMGARMSAMENATNNATELIDKLTIAFNRARQAAITKELIEIISGADAL